MCFLRGYMQEKDRTGYSASQDAAPLEEGALQHAPMGVAAPSQGAVCPDQPDWAEQQAAAAVLGHTLRVDETVHGEGAVPTNGGDAAMASPDAHGAEGDVVAEASPAAGEGVDIAPMGTTEMAAVPKDDTDMDATLMGGTELTVAPTDTAEGALPDRPDFASFSDRQCQEMCDQILRDNGAGVERDRQMAAAREAERVRRATSYDLPIDYVNAYVGSVQAACDNIGDALAVCMGSLGRVDMEYIAVAAGMDLADAVRALRDTELVYQDPALWQECFYKGWVTADEYLSGNVLDKYNRAQEATAKYLGHFDRNVAALRPLLPVRIEAKDIYFTLGSPWVPDTMVNDFVVDLLHLGFRLKDGVKHDARLNQWTVRYGTSASRYNTARMSAVEIIERTLNNRPVRVYDLVPKYGAYGGKPKMDHRLNQTETVAAVDMQRVIVAQFDHFVRSDPKRLKQLEDIFYTRYGCLRARHYNGRYLTLPGKNPDVTLYPHQKDAVARILYSRSTLLAHSVGTGKTYIMVAACMELRRMHLSEKNLFVVPKSILGQWQHDFAYLYPASRVLTVVPERDFTPAHRQDTLRRIKEEDWDAVLMANSSFAMIPLGMTAAIAEIDRKLRELPDQPAYQAVRRELQSRRARFEAQRRAETPGVRFEDLHITALFVDEAHNYKNITLDTGTVGRFAKPSGEHSDDMHRKVRYLSGQRRTKSIVFATGTPITNSIADMYAMQTFLQAGELRFLGLDSYNEWALMFGEQSEDFEIDVDATNYRMRTRFNRFHNLPELTNIFATVADYHLEDNNNLFSGTVDYHNIVVPRSKDQYDYIMSLAQRAQDIRSHNSQPGDNLLKVTTDGRRAALDYRLVDPTAPATPHCKVAYCADMVYRIYTQKPLCTQLIFCDVSTPKNEFNIYDEVKRLLVAAGIPQEQIAFVHTAAKDKERQALFEAVNRGEVRVLVGSTFKLGTGVNVQRRLFAVHHLDVPWRPGDMVQREGRMLRQGNDNDSVEIYRYITDGSFDAYSWQLLESKQRFISQLLYNSLDRRDGEDVDNLTLTYAQIKALAIGNPLIKQRVETANRLTRLLLRNKCKEARRDLNLARVAALPADIQRDKDLLACCKKDAATYRRHRDDMASRRAIGERILRRLETPVPFDEDEVMDMYKGFALVLPAHTTPETPVLVLRGCHDWRYDIERSALGIMNRTDYILEHFGDRAEELTKRIKANTWELTEAESELAATDDLDEQIEATRRELAKLDKALGVKHDE